MCSRLGRRAVSRNRGESCWHATDVGLRQRQPHVLTEKGVWARVARVILASWLVSNRSSPAARTSSSSCARPPAIPAPRQCSISLSWSVGRFCRVSIAEIGYELRPVIEYFTRLAIGARALPALVTPEWLLIPQVTVLSPWRYTMDGLLVVQQPRRTFINLEIDGRGHDHSGDTERTARLSMPTLRITENEVLENVSLTTRLRAIGYCLP
jgi:hypothetical protein